MTNRYAVVLAAGQGTRMKSKLYKVLAPCRWKTNGSACRRPVEYIRSK